MKSASLSQRLPRIAGKTRKTDYMAEISMQGRVSKHFHYWLGLSGKRYLHTVFDAKKAPHYADAVIMIVKADGSDRTPLYLAKTGKMPELVFSGTDFARAIRRGGNELHVHLMGRNDCDIKNIKSDLAYLLGISGRTYQDMAA